MPLGIPFCYDPGWLAGEMVPPNYDGGAQTNKFFKIILPGAPVLLDGDGHPALTEAKYMSIASETASESGSQTSESESPTSLS